MYVLAVSHLYIVGRYTSRGGREDVKHRKEWITKYLLYTVLCGSHSGLSTFFFPKETALEQIFCDHTIVS